VTTEIMESAQEQATETGSLRTLPAPFPLPKTRRHDPRKQQAAATPVIRVNEGSIFVANGRDPEDRVILQDDRSQVREKMFDKTLADSFPASEPPSSTPDPAEEDSFSVYHHEGGTGP
jgi:hypothetical protein